MDALLMCGGEGTRLEAATEKPLVTVGDRTMVERVADALAASRIDRIFGVTTPATPETARRLDCPLIETDGAGYVADLEQALDDDRVETPIVTVAADLPLLDGSAVDAVVDRVGEGGAVLVPVGRKRGLGLSVDTTVRAGGRLVTPAGINVVGAGEGRWHTADRRFAANVNRPSDLRRARWLVAGRHKD